MTSPKVSSVHVRLILQEPEFAPACLTLPYLGLFAFRLELSTPKNGFQDISPFASEFNLLFNTRSGTNELHSHVGYGRPSTYLISTYLILE